jgi:hypothetical protein
LVAVQRTLVGCKAVWVERGSAILARANSVAAHTFSDLEECIKEASASEVASSDPLVACTMVANNSQPVASKTLVVMVASLLVSIAASEIVASTTASAANASATLRALQLYLVVVLPRMALTTTTTPATILPTTATTPPAMRGIRIAGTGFMSATTTNHHERRADRSPRCTFCGGLSGSD